MTVWKTVRKLTAKQLEAFEVAHGKLVKLASRKSAAGESKRCGILAERKCKDTAPLVAGEAFIPGETRVVSPVSVV